MNKKNKDLVQPRGITFVNKRLSSLTVARYTTAVKKYLNYLEKMNFQSSPEAIKYFLIELELSVSPSTYNVEGQALKNYLLELYKSDVNARFVIQESFKRFFKRQTIQRTIIEDGYLSHKVVIKVAATLAPRWGILLLALYYSGARISELLNVHLSDIKSINGKATIKIRQGKGRKERTTFLPILVYTTVRRLYVAKGQFFLFEKETGGSYNRSYISNALSKKCKNLGYDIWPHKLRHSKAMYLKDERNLSADQIAKALGHKSVKTTLEHYFHGTPSAEDQGIFEYQSNYSGK